MKRTKTWRIGECCAGGVIQVKISNDKTMVGIRNATWENNETLRTRTFRIGRCGYDVELFLNDITTLYYASKIIEWIKENTK
jgi:hypothetical protein